MASKRAASILAAEQNKRIEQLLVAIAEANGINVAAVLNGETFQQVIEDAPSKKAAATAKK